MDGRGGAVVGDVLAAHELLHDGGAPDAELELLQGELAARADLAELKLFLDDELGAVVEVPD